jgi:hypothetical protein
VYVDMYVCVCVQEREGGGLACVVWGCDSALPPHHGGYAFARVCAGVQAQQALTKMQHSTPCPTTTEEGTHGKLFDLMRTVPSLDDECSSMLTVRSLWFVGGKG